MTDSNVQEVILVTGLSGAGKSTALNALEDLGYFCVDNLPPPVIRATLESLSGAGCQRVALGVDVRVRAFLDEAPQECLQLMEDPKVSLSVLYLDSSEELLARRFSTTRRPHPLTAQPSSEVRELLEGVRMEKRLLQPLRALATVVIETTTFSVHDLRRAIIRTFSDDREQRGGLIVRVLSFGFKFGAPRDVDMSFDVRFLPNPFFVEELRPQSGRDDAVASYVLGDPNATGFLERLLPLLSYCLPRFRSEGKSYLTIAIGCTGGRHRSVALAEEVGVQLGKELGFQIDVVHRDIGRDEHLPQLRRPEEIQASQMLESREKI